MASPSFSYAYITSFIGASWLALYFTSEAVSQVAFIAFLFAAALACTGFIFKKRSALSFVPLIVFFSVSLWQQNRGVQEAIDMQLPSELEGEAMVLEGIVVTIPERDGDFVRFQIKPNTIQLKDNHFSLPLDGLLRLSWRTEQQPSLGESWQLQVKLKRPRGFVNPKGFDYQAWLLSKGIIATGYVYGQENVLLESAQAYHLHSVRDNLSQKLSALFAGSMSTDSKPKITHSAILKALLIGDKSEISQTQWALFRKTGTIHLMAVSGLHVGLISAFACLLATLIFRPMVLVLRPIYFRIAVALVSIGFAFLYSKLSGYAIPTQRAFLCVALVNLIFLLERRCYFLPILGAIACVILWRQPFVLMQQGFVLSFAAVAILLFSFSGKTDLGGLPWWSWFKQFIAVQWVIFIGLFPFMLMLNLPSPMISPIANIIAVPVVSFIVLPSAFIACLVLPFSEPVAVVLFQLSDNCLHYLFHYLSFVSEDIPQLKMRFVLNSWQSILLLIASLMCLNPSNSLLRFAGVLIAVFMLSINTFSRKSHENEIIVLDVGQGLSSVIAGEKATLIYDVGAQFSNAFSIAKQVLLPYLETQRHAPISDLVISHADNDHAGDVENFLSEIQKIQSENISVVSGEAKKLNVNEALPCYQNRALIGSTLSDSIHITLLWPQSSDATFENANNASCVLLIEMDGKQILFTGDIEKQVEYELLNLGVLPKNIDVLIAPHHGSTTSSGYLFIHHLKPKHVIFSAGYKNRYRHPAKKIVARYQAIGSTLWNTADNGAISIKVKKNELVIEAERIRQPRRWYLAVE